MGGASKDLTLHFGAAGTQVVALSTDRAATQLPALRFNDYLRAEGLSPAIAWRQRTGTTNAPGREVYSRRAKLLVRAGAGGRVNAWVTRPLGLRLEIVPRVDPTQLPGRGALPVRVFYAGRPLPGALVKLTDLSADATPVATAVTDASGSATFLVPRAGQWLLNTIWTQPIADGVADFDTTFSSLAFGVTTVDR